MGYDTNFDGDFALNKPLKPEQIAYLDRFNRIRHVIWDEEIIKDISDPIREMLHLPLGRNGMYFTGEITHDMLRLNQPYESMHQRSLLFVPYEDISSNKTAIFKAPSHHCQWVPGYRGYTIEWDRGEKFYGYVHWLKFLLEHFLVPWGYQLNGTVKYRGEQGEHGRIIVTDNQVEVIVDGDSLLERNHGEQVHHTSGIAEDWKIHWITVGSLTERARQALLAADCPIRDISDNPPIVLIGLPYDSNHYKRYGYDDLRIFNSAGILSYTKNLHLLHDFNEYQITDNPWTGVANQRLMLFEEEREQHTNINLDSYLHE